VRRALVACLLVTLASAEDTELSVLQQIRDEAATAHAQQLDQGRRVVFLLQASSITLGILFGMYSWRLLLIAKSHKNWW